MSQSSAILHYLKSGKTLTPLEAFRRFGCLSLHSRASELRDRGHKIRCRIVRMGGKNVGCYSL